MAPVASPEVLEAEVPAVIQAMGGGDVDIQITTAKRFPRSIVTFKKVALEMACLDEETAESCFYALPRGGRTIEGPSARLAEICMTAWGNSRVEAKQVAEDDRFVTSRGTAWDLQTNVLVAFEVKRRITTSSKKGDVKKFDDDMIGVTSNAASSIALRNAVFKMIPAAFWKPIYHAARKAAVGDIKTLATRRADMLGHFQKLGATNEQVFGLLEVKGVDDITLDHMVTLKGLATALKDGETTFEEVFATVIAPIKPAERKSEQAAKTPPAQESSQAPAAQTVEQGSQQPAKEEARSGREMPSAAAGTVGGPSTSEPVSPSPNVGTITEIQVHGESIVVVLNTGFKCSTKDVALKTSAANLKDAKRIVELVTTKSKNPDKFMDRLDGIEPLPEVQ